MEKKTEHEKPNFDKRTNNLSLLWRNTFL